MARVPAPMLATAGPVPADDDLRYAYEFKYDGIRCLARGSGDTCHLITRNGNTITHSFPEIAQALIELAAGRVLILDSEIVTPDRGGVPRFGLMSRRLGVMRPSATLLRSVPAQMYAFDLLGVDGHDLRDLPYLDRREHLAGLGLPHGPIRISPYYLDVPVSRMLEVAAEHDLEGCSRQTRRRVLPQWKIYGLARAASAPHHRGGDRRVAAHPRESIVRVFAHRRARHRQPVDPPRRSRDRVHQHRPPGAAP
ncbi:hypothetical protein FEK35_19670 [Nocardia cyriacigeorgica]|uniref:ATP-dependent DNA ligase family profile domain-containing protein n=1 Tax=Nocardia cyriacigeorgica TaxID=135487 RepID=A0A5R8PBD0_9NOCA|nr:hypothetical protein [Nocardia cyriacigeorgica]TLG05377.1 hypothetical protein FEK35_19670 [Nocardia cyriacigeorgica]